ncbi:hypothetical protein ACWGA9_08095 [Streptomyces sp. NPDC054950]
MDVLILADEPEPGTVVAAQLRGAGFATAPARTVAVADLKRGT